MKTNLLFIGAFIAAGAIGAGAVLVLRPPIALAQPPAASPGRYQIVFSPRLERSTYMIDTATGRVWSPITFTNLTDEPTAWRLMDRMDIDADEPKLIAKYGFKKAATPTSKNATVD
jgi:hypothetical protein